MKEHLTEPSDLKQLARVVAVSKYHLVRVFDEITGISPRYFQACLRIQRAKEMLLAPGLPSPTYASRSVIPRWAVSRTPFATWWG